MLVSTLPDLPFLTLVLKYCACCLLRGYVTIANTLYDGKWGPVAYPEDDIYIGGIYWTYAPWAHGSP